MCRKALAPPTNALIVNLTTTKLNPHLTNNYLFGSVESAEWRYERDLPVDTDICCLVRMVSNSFLFDLIRKLCVLALVIAWSESRFISNYWGRNPYHPRSLCKGLTEKRVHTTEEARPGTLFDFIIEQRTTLLILVPRNFLAALVLPIHCAVLQPSHANSSRPLLLLWNDGEDSNHQCRWFCIHVSR